MIYILAYILSLLIAATNIVTAKANEECKKAIAPFKPERVRSPENTTPELGIIYTTK
ncbi:MAG: hypothetical protein SAK29_20940 [Scytonema sp. PMC 1069.18]|nr:hypothetical protein [Scytonema sp. PMC 1069.18]MEC4886714.1 hypothetical protein [Scytonema sp. PMC 1070.18]